VSFRLRLTLSVAAAVALAVAVACMIAYIVVGRQLYSQVDASLRDEAGQFVGAPRQPSANHGVPYAIYYYQWVSANGGVAQPRAFATQDPLPVTQQAIDAARSSSSFSLSTATVGGVHLRVATFSVGNGFSVQVARRLSDDDVVLSQLRIWFLLVAAGGIALAALLGAFVAREALRPVRKLTATAENVAETHDLTQRIEVSGTDELSRLATSFNTMLAALEQAVSAQRQLVADASHELRTPLTSLRTNFEVLMRPAPLPDDSRRKLEQDVHQQFDELAALVGDIVELARDGQSPGEEDDVRLDVLVAEAVERAERNARDVRFQLTSHPTMVRGVPGRLDRAVRNLLDNAAKWSPRGEVVEVEVGEGTVSVRDHGPGIADDDLPFIFDRFFRSAEARSMPGSGLGLAIVRQVAEGHGGHVTAETAPGGGTRFVFSVPPLPVPSEDLVDV